MINRFFVLSFLIVVNFAETYGQCRIDDYFLRAFHKDKFAIEKLYSDSAITTFYNYSNQSLYGNTNVDEIDAYRFKLKDYECVKSYRDNYCEVHFRKNKLYAVQINIYFDVNDSLLCKSAFRKFINESKVELKYPIVYSGTSERLLESSYRGKLDLKLTPFFQFYKTKEMKESIQIGYTYSNTSKEFELSIKFLNMKYIE
jgi:hypothetical protein